MIFSCIQQIKVTLVHKLSNCNLQKWNYTLKAFCRGHNSESWHFKLLAFMQRYNDLKMNALFSMMCDRFKLLQFYSQRLCWKKNIFTNDHLHSPFEFVWCLEPCACQLYKERKNVIPFPKEFMIQIQTRFGNREVGGFRWMAWRAGCGALASKSLSENTLTLFWCSVL